MDQSTHVFLAELKKTCASLVSLIEGIQEAPAITRTMASELLYWQDRVDSLIRLLVRNVP